jgi:hypothetical protein
MKRSRRGYNSISVIANAEKLLADRVKKADYDVCYHYKLTPSDRDAIWLAQGACCPGCGVGLVPSSAFAGFCIDHDHESGLVRGILCDACNRAIGFAHDQPDILRRLALYLELTAAGAEARYRLCFTGRPRVERAIGMIPPRSPGRLRLGEANAVAAFLDREGVFEAVAEEVRLR